MSYEPLYTINWAALNAMDPADRQEALAGIGDDVKRVVASARAHIVRRAVDVHGTQAEAARQLGISPVRANQILREAPPMVTICPVVEPDALYCHYRNEHQPQPVYIYLDLEDRELSADYNADVGNARPGEIYYGLVREYRIPALTAQAANQAMAEIRPFAERIVADWERVWDGQAHVAVLGDDARAAEEDLRAHLGDPDDWSPEDQVEGISADGLGDPDDWSEISADTTDAELDAAAAQTVARLAEAAPSGVITGRAEDVVREFLRELRDDRRADADDS